MILKKNSDFGAQTDRITENIQIFFGSFLFVSILYDAFDACTTTTSYILI